MQGALALLSFVAAFAVIRLVLWRWAHLVLDRPNERSLHQQPIPRTGGMGVLAGVALSLAFGSGPLGVLIGLTLLLAVVSFLDDVYGMPTGVRLATHMAAAGLLVWYVLAPMELVSLTVLAVSVAWITNLYNFMDGSDGLAGGMAVIGFTTYAFAAQLAGDAGVSALSLAVAAASLAFLFHNFHPARIFLGDVGSIPLGFLAAGVGVVGWRDDVWPLWFPVLVFGPFIGDATVTLLRRLLRGERVWRAHREHYYQRMVRMGLGHRATAYAAYACMLVCALAALWGRTQPPGLQAAAFAGASAVLATLAVWVDVRWARFSRPRVSA